MGRVNDFLAKLDTKFKIYVMNIIEISNLISNADTEPIVTILALLCCIGVAPVIIGSIYAFFQGGRNVGNPGFRGNIPLSGEDTDDKVRDLIDKFLN